MNSKYYQPSGQSSSAGIPMVLAIGLISALILGAIYAYATFYIPFIYISFLLTIGFAFALGYIIDKGIEYGKVRNPKLSLGLAALIGVFAVYCAWLIWFYAFSGTLLLNPIDLNQGQKILGMMGAWSISDLTPTGWALYAFWLVEAAIITGGTILFSRNQVHEPFCETCDKWVEGRMSKSFLTVPEDPTALVKSLENGDASLLVKLAKNEGSPYTKVTLKDCPTCKKFHLLDLSFITLEANKDGEMEEKEALFMENLLINFATFDTIKKHLWPESALAE